MDTPLNLNEAILNLQRYLRAISFVDERITRVPTDGIFGSDTLRAVEEYQRTRGLPDTGIVDKRTWDTLFDEYRRLTTQTERPPTPSLFPAYPELYEAAVGERSAFVALLQLLLRELKAVYDGLPEIEADGIYGANTEGAVRIFQELNGLTPNGRTDSATWNRLISEFLTHAPF